MNLEALLGLYKQDNRLKQLAAGLSLPKPKIRATLSHLRGSAAAFIAAATGNHSPLRHIFVLNDKDDAAYFFNDLENLIGKSNVFFFPDSYKRAGDYTQYNDSHIMLRTEALFHLENTKNISSFLVTYPEALIEKVIDKKALLQNRIHIATGAVLNVEELLEKLVDLGFRKEDFVYEPGQFAIRGGILDIYSFGNEHPYRIELFGKEVDSIRIFNPETQLSERKLVQVSILPNIESGANGGRKVPLSAFLPENTVYWFADLGFCTDRLQLLETEIADALPETDRTDKAAGELPETASASIEMALSLSDFDTCENWLRHWQDRHLLVLNDKAPFGLLPEGPDARQLELSFDTAGQPAFNRNFKLLTDDLSTSIAAGYQVFLFAENPKQLERLRSIFEDIGTQISFVPVPLAISKGFIDRENKRLVYTDHEIFHRYHKYRIKQTYSKGKAITIKTLRELQQGDYVAHIDHGIGVYSGLQKIEVNGNLQEAIRIIYRDNDVLYVNINSLHKISKYTGKEGTVPKVNKLGSDAWEKLKNKTKKQVKDIAADLIRLYAKRKASKGFAHGPDTYLQTELESSFLYEDTPDQAKAVADVKRDMEAQEPMDRLVCGDVGFGKTEVAVRAAFKTVNDSKQAAILVPTTILAFQHYQTFRKRLKDFPANVDFLNRFKTAKEKKETLQQVAEGKIDIIIGTHALLGKDIKFKDLGLLVIDEEQKFGVAAKEKIRERKHNVDTLTLTATPIPRTLQFSLMSARDLSIINTPPPNRQPVHTEVAGFDEQLIRDAIYFEVERGGQVYFVHNRVQSLPSMVEKLQALCPDLEIAMAHGQMDGNRLEKTLLDFINKKYDILCSTNIVESGVDISNANTIFINNAHQFGLSDLHQLRGRVGRSNKKAFCYLLAPSLVTLPADSRKRLQTLEQFNELGSGFQIAMRDLDLRGAGNLVGGEQSGFINDIGMETYQKILAEAMRELKQTEFKTLFAEELARKKDYVSDCTVDTDLEILIPDSYITNIAERLNLYTRLNHIESEAGLQAFATELADRFGTLPQQVEDLFTAMRCRKIAKDLGFEKLILKEQTMRLYFIDNPESPYFETELFQHILRYIQTQTLEAKLKQKGKNFYLSVSGVGNIREAQHFLEQLQPADPVIAES